MHWPQGYIGDNCHTEFNECISRPCQNEGVCTDELSAYTCACVPGWSGDNCETARDECGSGPCLHDSECTDGIDEYTCTCAAGYDGENCDVDIDECQSAPCLNAGRCTESVDAYSCLCSSGYTGDNCEEEVQACETSANTCDRSHAQCIADGPGQFTCECQVGFETRDRGATCTEIDECASRPCVNGRCSDGLDSYFCECYRGFIGDNCDEDRDECASVPCEHEGRCYDGVDSFDCQCVSGWAGDSCQINVDECNSVPCQNDGVCIDGVAEYTCECTPGVWEGENCRDSVNLCERNEDNCDSEHAECVHTGPGEHSCDCDPGYTTINNGVDCTEVDECDSVPCLHRARCTDGDDSYTCACTTGWSGDNCAESEDDCQSMPCLNGGECQDEDDKYNCVCLPGFGGAECQTETDECVSQPCLNGGRCVDDILSYDCDCVSGFDGENCAAVVDPCSRNEADCSNEAECIHTGPGTHICECYPGFSTNDRGRTCVDIDDCESSPCQNGAACSDGRDAFRCRCASGWTGILCEMDVDECISRPCLNRGQCLDAVDSYQCHCRPGYEGDNCDTQNDLCSSRPCQHGAACRVQHIEGILSYVCSCTPGWVGGNCEEQIDECASAPCQNSARCEDGIDAYSCVCTSGWIGEDCDQAVNACDRSSNTCDREHGECISTGPGTHVCQCDVGYQTRDQGSTCTNVDECRSMPCLNGGRCTDEIDSYLCECIAGIAGVNCEVDVDECVSSPCVNDGRCQDRTDAYECTCSSGYTGENCDVDIDECGGRGTQCQNGGACADDRNSFRCTCRTGYTGRTCERDVSECASMPCMHGGFCSEPEVGSYVCDCNSEFAGDNCEQLAGGDGKVDPAEADGTIACDQTISGSTVDAANRVGNAAGDAVYLFSIPTGTFTVRFDACASDYDTVLRIMTADLTTEVTSCDDCGPCGVRTLLDTILDCTDMQCDYMLVIEGYSSSEGNFEVEMSCTQPNGVDGSIACQQTVTGNTAGGSNELGSTSSDHFYSFSVPVDAQVQFDSCRSSFDTFLRIYSSDLARELHSCDDCGSCGTRTVLDADLRAGDYVLVVEGYRYSEGEYSVTMNCPNDGDFSDGAIACGDTVTGTTVSAGSHVGNGASDHVYTFSLSEGTQLVQFDSCESQFDTYLRIMDPDLTEQLEGCDDCGQCGQRTVLDAELVCNEETCDYALVVEGYADIEGEYSVTMTCEDPAAIEGSVTCGETVVGDTADSGASGISEGRDHFYSFSLESTRLVQFDSCDSSYDTFLRIMSPDLADELHSCDDCGDCGTRSVLDAELPAGEYILVIGGWDTSEGEYSVTMNCPRRNRGFVDGVVSCDQTIVGSTVGVGTHVGNGAVKNSDAFCDLFAVRLANPKSITISGRSRLQVQADGGLVGGSLQLVRERLRHVSAGDDVGHGS